MQTQLMPQFGIRQNTGLRFGNDAKAETSTPATSASDSVQFDDSNRLANIKKSMNELRDEIKKITLIESQMMGLMGWDAETGGMPERGINQRVQAQGIANEFFNDTLASEKMQQLLNTLSKATVIRELSPLDQAIVREWKKQLDNALKIPPAIKQRESDLTNGMPPVWAKARGDNNFAAFAPGLTQLFSHFQEKADWLKPNSDSALYDVLLNQFEPGSTTANLKTIFAQLQSGTVPLIQKIADAKAADPKRYEFAFLDRPLTQAEMDGPVLDFCKQVVSDMGLDPARLTWGFSAHPFSTTMGAIEDTRITVRKSPENPTLNDVLFRLFAAMHEAGHASYEQGGGEHLIGTGLQAGSLGLHESQSRLWENMVGRSEAFWTHYFPLLQKALPEQLKDVDQNTFYRAVNNVTPSSTRVEADELTYHMHVLVRFLIEEQLINGTGDMKEVIDKLPDTWNRLMTENVGYTPASNAEGVLQDVHWSAGLVGYFPTYTQGTLNAVQLFKQAEKELAYTTGNGTVVTLEDQIRKGDMKRLMRWLNTNVHHNGQMETTQQIMKRVTGEETNPAHFIEYANQKFKPLYGL